MTRLHASDIGHRFGRNVLFRGLEFELLAGDSLAITGPNGSGKSTLLHIIAGLLTPRKGAIRLEIDGTPVSAAERPYACGLVAPYLNVYDGFSVRENLAFIARARGISGSEAQIRRVIEDVGLTHRADDRVQTFSSGMKQRVKFAAAELAQPRALLLDEPSTNLDEEGLAMVADLRRRVVARGGLVIIATNDRREAASCDERLNVESFR